MTCPPASTHCTASTHSTLPELWQPKLSLDMARCALWLLNQCDPSVNLPRTFLGGTSTWVRVRMKGRREGQQCEGEEELQVEGQENQASNSESWLCHFLTGYFGQVASAFWASVSLAREWGMVDTIPKGPSGSLSEVLGRTVYLKDCVFKGVCI